MSIRNVHIMAGSKRSSRTVFLRYNIYTALPSIPTFFTLSSLKYIGMSVIVVFHDVPFLTVPHLGGGRFGAFLSRVSAPVPRPHKIKHISVTHTTFISSENPP